MFVTILSSIYLALAIFVVVRLVNKKRQNVANWIANKGYSNTTLHRLISPKEPKQRPKADISKVYVD